MGDSHAASEYDLALALEWGEKIASALENPSFDKDCRLVFRFGIGEAEQRSITPGMKKCGRAGRIEADPEELAQKLRHVFETVRALCLTR